MQWQSWNAFWHMGGNAWFVWGSYGLALTLILFELLQLRNARRSTCQRLLRWRKATATDKAHAQHNTAQTKPATPHGNLT